MDACVPYKSTHLYFCSLQDLSLSSSLAYENEAFYTDRYISFFPGGLQVIRFQAKIKHWGITAKPKKWDHPEVPARVPYFMGFISPPEQVKYPLYRPLVLLCVLCVQCY